MLTLVLALLLASSEAIINCNVNEYYYGLVAGEGFCSKCPSGRYSDGCTDCQDSAEAGGLDVCEIRGLPCPQGSFVFAKTEGDGTDAHSCHQCPAAYYSDKVHADECFGCEAGTYQPEVAQSSCKSCESGKYADTDLSVSCKSCTSTAYSCPLGSKSVTALGSKYTSDCQCETCGVGTFSDEATTTCTTCEKGSYQDSEGAAACKSCERGWYESSEGSVGCTKCPVHTHTDAKGAESEAQCVSQNCEPGHFELIIPGGDSSCEKCPAGKYGTKEEGVSKCIECSPITVDGNLVGTYAHEDGLTSCAPCPQISTGSSQDTVPNEEKTSCTATWCHAGRYKYLHPQTQLNYCLPCPAGKFGTIDTPSVGGVCQDCESGRFQAISAKTTCDACPATTWTNNALGATECETAPTRAPTPTPTTFPTPGPTPPPTPFPTAPTPAPTPIHFTPGLAATVTLSNVSVHEFPSQQHIFENVIAEAFGCKENPGSDAVCGYGDVHVDEIKSAKNDECDRVLFSGIEAGHEQADRMGYYYKTHHRYEGRPVYEQHNGVLMNYLYWTHKGWVVGPKSGGRIAGLITDDAHADDASELNKEWYTFITNAEYLDGEWLAAPTLKMECKPTPVTTVWFNIHNHDCSVEGKHKMDHFPDHLTDEIGLSYNAEGSLAHKMNEAGLLTTHMEKVYTTIVSCAPLIKLSLGQPYMAKSRETHTKRSCRFDGSAIHMDLGIQTDDKSVAIKGTSQTGQLQTALPGTPETGTLYKVVLDGTGQVQDIDGAHLLKIGTLPKNCQNRFIIEKGVWRCECYHFDAAGRTAGPVTEGTLPPSAYPTSSPTAVPTPYPTPYPSTSPTQSPTQLPSNPPTNSPTAVPTKTVEGWAYKSWWEMDTAN